MISDDSVKQLFWQGQRMLAGRLDPNEVLPNQFFRGRRASSWEGQPPGACMRHMKIFNQFNAIPEFCFSCYKVVIEPRNVIEHFKLLVMFERIELPDDNTRKCAIECREDVSGFYKGLIYCQNVVDAEEIIRLVREMLPQEISEGVPVTLKRGCSEYALAYPAYEQVEPADGAMEYQQEWRVYEEQVDSDYVVNMKPTTSSHNQPAYTLRDAKVMLAWVKYAATIGDQSYLKITGETLSPWNNIKRPHPFKSTGNE